ncbi:uncharacterized protein [Cicer arietinum]|uniref:Uncharacterized protein LOC101492370 n=1 Tax=Cicer arietinum TaxID=3827 RepID=A0A1S2XFJ5_CICAR|nr:uncharacterized protein LOC101492370 [Cicer arietinum]
MHLSLMQVALQSIIKWLNILASVKEIPFPCLLLQCNSSRIKYHCSMAMNIDDNVVSLTPKFPVSQLNFSLEIKGNKTEIIISSYEDHFRVVATQIGTMGTILHARKEEGMSIDPTFNVSVLFGKRDEPMLVACACQLIEHMR